MRTVPNPDLTPAQIESSFVALILAISACAGGNHSADWLSAVAVFLSFLCTQVAFDMAEENGKSAQTLLSGPKYRRLYLAKEFFWIVTCVALQNYPLIASTAVFATYPLWRSALRNPSLRQVAVPAAGR